MELNTTHVHNILEKWGLSASIFRIENYDENEFAKRWILTSDSEQYLLQQSKTSLQKVLSSFSKEEVKHLDTYWNIVNISGMSSIENLLSNEQAKALASALAKNCLVTEFKNVTPSLNNTITAYQQAQTQQSNKVAMLDKDLVELAEIYQFLADEDLSQTSLFAYQPIYSPKEIFSSSNKILLCGTNDISYNFLPLIFGQLFRLTCVNAVETEVNLAKVKINEKQFSEILTNFVNNLPTAPTPKDLALFIYGCKHIAFQQALHYMTLYLNSQEQPNNTDELQKTMFYFTLLHQIFHREDQLQYYIEQNIGV